MGLSLWQMNEKIEQIIYEGTDRDTGEISDEALAELELMEMDREEKAINWGLYIKGEIAEGEAVQKQADALTMRAKGHKARAETLRGRLERLLEAGECFKDPRVIVKWRKSSAVEIYAPEDLPPEFFRQKPAPPPTADKAEIRRALSVGDIPGARMDHRQKLVVE